MRDIEKKMTMTRLLICTATILALKQIQVFNASTENEIDAAFALVAKQKSDALSVVEGRPAVP
jgi:hypothetical protein